MRSTTHNDQFFCDGDEVYHHGWDTTGTVHVPNDNRPAEVQWHGTNVADELDRVADQLEILS